MSLNGVTSTGQWLSSTAIQAVAKTSTVAIQSGTWAGKQVVAIASTVKGTVVVAGQQIGKLVALALAVFRQLGAAVNKGITTVTPYLSQASQAVVSLLKANAKEIKIVAATAVATLALAYLANKFLSQEAQPV